MKPKAGMAFTAHNLQDRRNWDNALERVGPEGLLMTHITSRHSTVNNIIKTQGSEYTLQAIKEGDEHMRRSKRLANIVDKGGRYFVMEQENVGQSWKNHDMDGWTSRKGYYTVAVERMVYISNCQELLNTWGKETAL